MSPAFTGLRDHRVRVCASLVTLLVMGACHKKPEAPPPAPVTAPPPKPSKPLPPRTPGLWETTVSEEGSADPAQVMRICIDARTDKHLGILGTDLSGDACTKQTFQVPGAGAANGAEWELLAECQMGTGVVTEYSGSISGDYATAYTLKVRSQTTGGSLPQMNRVTTYLVTSKHVGACEKDQKPGDLINEGVKVNLFDMAGLGDKNAASQSAPPDVVD